MAGITERTQHPELPSNAPFHILTERERWVPVTDRTDIRVLRTFAAVINPVFKNARAGSYLLLDEAALVCHQLRMEDRAERPEVPNINILLERDISGRTMIRIGRAFHELGLPGSEITVHEADRETPHGYEYENTGLRLEADGFPPINIVDQLKVSLPPSATENGDLYNVTVELPTKGSDIFGQYHDLDIKDFRSGKGKDEASIAVCTPYLIRMLKVIRAGDQDLRDLEILARMGYFDGVPTLLPTGDEYDRLRQNSIEVDSQRTDADGLASLDALKSEVHITFSGKQGYYNLLREGALPEELEGSPSEGAGAGSKIDEWVVNRDRFDRGAFPHRDYHVIPEGMTSAAEHNRKHAETWVAMADEYEGGGEKFWLDLLTVSVQSYTRRHHINIAPRYLENFLLNDLTKGYHAQHHTGNIVVQTREIVDAIQATAPALMSEKRKNTAIASAAAHDVIMAGVLVEEDIIFGNETITRVKRNQVRGDQEGGNEFESAKVAQYYMQFVNTLYEAQGREPIFDPEAGFENVLATLPVKRSGETIEQMVFSSSMQRPDIQAILLADIGAENGMANGRQGVRTLLQNSWGIIMEEEPEVKAAFYGYKISMNVQGGIDFEHTREFSDTEKERLAKIIKARMLGQQNFNNDRRSTRGNPKIHQQISQMDPRIQEAVTEIFQPDSRDSIEAIAQLNFYYEHLQELSYDDLIIEASRFGHPTDQFEGKHQIEEDMPLYMITPIAA
ncbi:MAG TPA: hypothetical protein VLF93_05520 [Candidatus Saccharimonadales bacterium]|nr:hypothetical protein [Candidatus Saccharimonadales bacterium]